MTGVTPVELVAEADALVDQLGDGKVHDDLASLVASYRSHRSDGTAWIHARALLRCADRVGVEVQPAKAWADLKVDDLKAEIDRRNEGRDEGDLIVPQGTKKADLVAALEADAARE